MVERSKSIGLDLLALAAGAGAVWCVAAQIVDQGMGVLWISVAIPLGLVAWGLWQRALWGLSLAVVVTILGMLVPPIVLLSGCTITPKDSIGAGILMFYGVISCVTVLPVCLFILWYLLRAKTRARFD